MKQQRFRGYGECSRAAYIESAKWLGEGAKAFAVGLRLDLKIELFRKV